MKKVAFYLRLFLTGGTETSLIRYIKALDKNIFDITLIIGINMKDYELFINQIPSHVKVKYVLQDSRLCHDYFYKKRSNNFTFKDKLAKIFIKPLRNHLYRKYIIDELSNYDVVIDYAMDLIRFSNRIPKRLIGFFHFSLDYYLAKPRNFKLYQRNLRYYDKLIVLNQSMYDQFVKYFAAYKDLAQVFYNQFDFSVIRNLAQCKVDDITSTDYIVSVARLEENQKDFTSLFYAFAKIKDKVSTDLIVIGDGSDRHNLQELINKLGLADRVYLYGHKNNPFPYIKNSRFFVFSSKHEGFGLVLVEAMILSRAVISSDCPVGPYEITAGGECGLLFKVGDVDALASHMYTLINNQAAVDNLVKKADALLDRFDINKNIKQLEELL